MKEHYVSFEQAVNLYELGFDVEVATSYYTHAWMDEPKLTQRLLAIVEAEMYDGTDIYPAPRLDQAAAWLWEKYKLWIEVTIKAKNDFTLCIVDEYGEVKFIGDGKDSIPNTYIAGIDKALELLGKEEKEKVKEIY